MNWNRRLLLTLQSGLLGLALASAGLAGTGCGAAADADSAPSDVADGEGVAASESADELPATLAVERGPAPTAQNTSGTARGPFQVQSQTPRGIRNGPAYGSQTLHWPTNIEGQLASIAIVPGFASPESSTRPWGPFLASHGIVALTIGTNSTLDQPPARARALLDALETLRSENRRNGSPIFGRLDESRQAIAGWSMGGGGTLIAAQQTPSLKAAIGICAWNPGARFANNRVPTLLFAGTADVLAGGQSQGFYQSIPNNTSKLLYEVRGADHFFANNPRGQNGAVGRLGLAWLKVFLEEDTRYKQFLNRTYAPNTSDFRTNVQ